MRIILQKEVETLGVPGDVVEVADGYARNYLVPRGFAVAATKGAVRHAERVRKAQGEQLQRALEEAETRREELERDTIRVIAKAGEEGQLFGSITAKTLAEALSKVVGWEVDRRRIALGDAIRSIGSHEVKVHLHPEVNATVTVEVLTE